MHTTPSHLCIRYRLLAIVSLANRSFRHFRVVMVMTVVVVVMTLVVVVVMVMIVIVVVVMFVAV